MRAVEAAPNLGSLHPQQSVTLLMPVISTRRRWKQEDQLVEIQKTVNTLAEQNKVMLNMLNRMSPQPVETEELPNVEVVITEPTS